MSVALAVTPASGSVIHVTSLVRVDLTGADPTKRQRIKATQAGQTDLLSHEFQPSSDGKHSWFNIYLPTAGTWTFAVYATDAPNSNLATLAVTVS